MPVTFKSLGEFELYEPAEYPSHLPRGILFARRVGDETDWYELIHGEDPEIAAGRLYATVENIGGKWTVQAVSNEPDRLFPQRSHLVEIKGFTGKDPQAELGQTFVPAKVFKTD